MCDSTLAALLDQLHILTLDDDVLLQRWSILSLQVVQNPNAIRTHIPVLNFR